MKYENCVPPYTRADLAGAKATLTPYVESVRQAFVAGGVEKVRGTRWRVDAEAHNGGRNFAGHLASVREDSTILLAPQMVLLPEPTILGIIAHEFGHAADYLYPGQWILTPRGDVRFTPAGARTNDGVPRGVAEWWRRRDNDTVESTADRIAETVLRIKIGYAGPCRLQTVGAGIRPRPKGLR